MHSFNICENLCFFLGMSVHKVVVDQSGTFVLTLCVGTVQWGLGGGGKGNRYQNMF